MVFMLTRSHRRAVGDWVPLGPSSATLQVRKI